MVTYILSCLVCPEAEGSTSTLHDGFRTQTAENARLVLLTGIEVGDDSIIRVGQRRLASWTAGASVGTVGSDAK